MVSCAGETIGRVKSKYINQKTALSKERARSKKENRVESVPCGQSDPVQLHGKVLI